MAAKVYARVFDYSSAGQSDGAMRFTVEWSLLGGSRDGGKVQFTISNIANDNGLRDDLREALAAYLTSRYSTEFRPRDIVGYSV